MNNMEIFNPFDGKEVDKIVWPFYRYSALIPEQLGGDLFVWLYLSLIVYSNESKTLPKDTYNDEGKMEVQKILADKFANVIDGQTLEKIVNNAERDFTEITKDLNGKNIYCYLKRIQKLKTKNPYTEECIIQILNKNNIKYVHNKRISYHDKNYKKYNGHKGIHNFEMDFLINKNKVIEIQGDYWHGNMKLYPILNEKQKCAKEKDKFKKNDFLKN